MDRERILSVLATVIVSVAAGAFALGKNGRKRQSSASRRIASAKSAQPVQPVQPAPNPVKNPDDDLSASMSLANRDAASHLDEFAAAVSHELRTVLSSIKAYVELLIDGEATDPKTTSAFYAAIEKETDGLGRWIECLLPLTRLGMGAMPIHRRPQNLSEIVREAVELVSPQARAKQITLSPRLSTGARARGDAHLIYRAVLNLLSNAVKYTPRGGTVIIETKADCPRKMAMVMVSDSGIGILPKDLPFVFDKFFRTEASRHMAEGSGLGLSLVKHIVETLHHGRLLACSEVDKGSCFGFELPLCDGNSWRENADQEDTRGG